MWRSRWRAAIGRAAPYESLELRAVMSASSMCWEISGSEPSSLYAPAVRVPETEIALPASVAPASVPIADAIGVSYVHERYGLRGTGQTVVVIDSGIAYDHYAFGGGFGAGHRVVGGWDFTPENDADPYDDGPAGFHGTHVAGIIGSSDPEHLGIAPEVDLVALRVFDDRGNGDLGRIEKALTWVATHVNAFEYPITTVSISIGTRWNSNTVPTWATLEDELRRLNDLGLFVAVAAGNDFQKFHAPGLSYPATSPYVVPVASVGEDGELSDFSQRSSRAIAAPGEQIMSTVPDHLHDLNGVADDFGVASGTSMATPFVAAASVLIREALEISGDAHVTQQDILNVMTQTAQRSQDATTGIAFSRLDLAAAIRAVLPQELVPDPRAGMPETVELGTVDRDANFALNVEAGAQYRLSLAKPGAIRVAVTSNSAAASFRVLDVNGQTLATSSPVNKAAPQRTSVVELRVDRVQDLMVEFDSAVGNATLRVEQFVEIDQRQMLVRGTTGNDQIGLAMSGHLVVNAFTFDWRDQSLGSIVIEAGPGEDEVNWYGSTQTESVAMSPGNARISAIGLSITVADAERINVSSGGGADRIELRGGLGHDEFIAKSTFSWMRGPGYLNFAKGFDDILAIGSGRGDEASFHAAPDVADRMGMRPNDVTWQSAGRTHRAQGFDVAYAYGNGADDRLFLYDSAGDDRLTLRPTAGWIVGPGYVSYGEGFGVTEVHASSGYDRARMFGSPDDDALRATPSFASLTGKGYRQETFDFDWVEAFAEGGSDRAEFVGSSAADRFVGKPTHSWLAGDGYLNYANGFASIRVDGRGGRDESLLVGSAGNDQAWLSPQEAAFSAAGVDWIVWGMEQITIESRGGHDRAELQGSNGDDLLRIAVKAVEIAGANYLNSVVGFRQVIATAEMGHDRSVIDQLAADDQLVELAHQIVLARLDSAITAIGFALQK